MAASCFGICSGDEILGRSLALEGERKYKERQNSQVSKLKDCA